MQITKKQLAIIVISLILITGYIALPFVARYIDFRKTIIKDYDLVNAFSNLSFDEPISTFSHPTNPNYLYVLEKNGRLQLITLSNSKLHEQSVFLDLSETYNNPQIHGFSFDPAFASNQYFYVEYALDDPLRMRISRFQFTPYFMSVDVNSELVIAEYEYSKNKNLGSGITFDKDGLLYFGIGDGDFPEAAQNLSSYYGKILRIDIQQATANSTYTIPSDNPFINDSTVLPEIYAYGLHNPSNIYYSVEQQQLFIVENQGKNQEEINIILSKHNYGWPITEGDQCLTDEELCANSTITAPIWTYDHNLGNAIIGGGTYQGSQYTYLQNKYIYGDYSSGRIWILGKNSSDVYINELLVKKPIHITGFGTNFSGEIYICGNNKIYTIVRVTD